MYPIVVRLRRRVGLQIVAGALVIGLLGWFVLVAKHSTVERLFPSLWVTLSACALCAGVGILWRPPRVLLIDWEGITSRYPLSSRGLISWSEIRGAHFAKIEQARYGLLALYVMRRSWRIVALELVDPARFQALHDKRFYLGYSTGFVPDYFPIRFGPLDIDADELLSMINEGIARNGRLAPDSIPQTTYQQPSF